MKIGVDMITTIAQALIPGEPRMFSVVNPLPMDVEAVDLSILREAGAGVIEVTLASASWEGIVGDVEPWVKAVFVNRGEFEKLSFADDVEAIKLAGKTRDPGWPAFRKHFLIGKRCAACGGVDFLELHHVLPFHDFPEKELDEGNVIPLCEKPSRNCHFVFGHALNWKGYVKTVRDDAARQLRHVATSAAIAKA